MRKSYAKKKFSVLSPDVKSGHITFNANESKTHAASLIKEKIIMENFEKNKEEMDRPRNPIIGGCTPRNGLFRVPLIEIKSDSSKLLSATILETRKNPDIANKIGILEKKVSEDLSGDFLSSLRRRHDVLKDALAQSENELKVYSKALDKNYSRFDKKY